MLRLSASQTRLRNEYAAEKQKTKELSQVCEETQGKVTALEQSKLAVEADVRQFSKRVQELETSNSELAGELRQAKEEQESLKEDLSSLQTSKATVEHELKAAIGSKQILESQMSSLSESGQNVVEELAGLKSKLMSFEKAHAESQVIIRSLESKKISLQEELRVAKTNLSVTYGSEAELRSQLDGLHQREFSLENQLSHALARLQSIERTYSESRATIGSLELEKNSIDEELRVTKFRLSAATDLEENLRSELTNLQRREAELEQNLITAQTAVAKLELNLNAAHTKMDAMGESIKLLAERLEASEASKAQFERMAKLAKQSRVRIEAHLKAVKKDKQKAQAGLGSVKTRLVASEVSKMHLEARLSLTEKELAAALDRNNELEDMLDKTESDLIAVEATTTMCEAQLEAFVEDSRARLAEAEKANEEMASSKAKTEDQLSEHKKEIQSLQQVNTDLQAKLAEMTEELNKIKASKFLPALQDPWHQEDLPLGINPDFLSAAEFFNLELKDLRDTQHAFNKVVTSLQEKNEHLQTLQEWCGEEEEEVWIDEHESPPPSRPTSGVSEAIELAYPTTPSGLDAVPETSVLQTSPQSVRKAASTNVLGSQGQPRQQKARNVLQKPKPGSAKPGNMQSVSDTAVNDQRLVGVYDPRTKTWKTQSTTRKPPPRSSSRPQVQMPARQSENATETYDPVTKTWKFNAPAKVAPPPKSASRPKPSTSKPGTFDAETRTWTVGGPTPQKRPRTPSASTTNSANSSSGIYDPETRTWSFAAPTKTKAPKGGVETYDPVTKTWVITPAPKAAVPKPAKGGVESYDPITKTWTVTEAPKAARSKSPKSNRSLSPRGEEVYDPITKKWTVTNESKATRSKSPYSNRSKSPSGEEVYDPITKKWTVTKAPKATRAKSPKGEEMYDPITKTWSTSPAPQKALPARPDVAATESWHAESPRSSTRTRSSAAFSDNWDPETKSWNRTAPLSPRKPKARTSRDFDQEIEDCEAEIGAFDYEKRIWSLFPKAPKPAPKKDKQPPIEGFAEYDPETRKWVVKPVPHLEPAHKHKHSWSQSSLEDDDQEEEDIREAKEHADAVASVGKFDPTTKKWSLFHVGKKPKQQTGPNIGTWDPATKSWTADPPADDDDDDEEEEEEEKPGKSTGIYDPFKKTWSFFTRSSKKKSKEKQMVEKAQRSVGAYDPVAKKWSAPEPVRPHSASINSIVSSHDGDNEGEHVVERIPVVDEPEDDDADPGIYDPITGTWHAIRPRGTSNASEESLQIQDLHQLEDPGIYNPETGTWDHQAETSSRPPSQMSQVDGHIVPAIGDYDPETKAWNSPHRLNSAAPAPDVPKYHTGSLPHRTNSIRNGHRYRPQYRPTTSPTQQFGNIPASPTSTANHSGKSYMNLDDDSAKRPWGSFWRGDEKKSTFPSPPPSHTNSTPTLLSAGIASKKEKKGWKARLTGKKTKALEHEGKDNSECVIQ
jgi:predicted  nucleic acid-binding Zn-ribbon protein